jgi:hypothetical protein
MGLNPILFTIFVDPPDLKKFFITPVKALKLRNNNIFEINFDHHFDKISLKLIQ